MAKKKLTVGDNAISLFSVNDSDYLSITDIAKSASDREPSELIRSWLRNASTLEFLDMWEKLHNANFKPGQMDRFMREAQKRTVAVSAKKYIEETEAIGLVSKSGRYGGTWGHQDVAFNFAYWLSPAFQVRVAKEFLHLKQSEAQRLGKVWSVKREISKANHSLQADAIRAKLVPGKMIGTRKEGLYFANEADLLNMVVFGQTAKQWKAANPKKKGNQRDHATIVQLAVLANLEALNSKLIEWDCDQEQRYQLLAEEAERQQVLLSKNAAIKRLDK